MLVNAAMRYLVLPTIIQYMGTLYALVPGRG